MNAHLGKGGGGGALPGAIPTGGSRGAHHHGGGHHHHGGFHHWGGGPRGRYYGPWAYEVPVISYGLDIDELLRDPEEEERKKRAATKVLAQEIVKQLKSGRATVGGDLDLLEAEILGEEDKGGDKGKSSGGGGGGFFGDFGISSIFNTAGNLAQAGVNIWQKEEEKKKAEAATAKGAAEERSRLSTALVADVAATQAAARAAFAANQKLPSAQVDAAAAAQAALAQARAGARLSPESTDQRIEAARKALAAATAKAQAAPKDAYALSTMNAWQATLNKIQNAQITGTPGAAAGPEPGGGGGGWLAGKTGPVPNKVIAGVGVVGVGALLIKALLR